MGKDLPEPGLPAAPAREQGVWGSMLGLQSRPARKPQAMARGAEAPAGGILPKFLTPKVVRGNEMALTLSRLVCG